jgi:ribosomal protein L7/L12
MENTPVDIQELIRQGRLIEAIKVLRETSGLDLKTAKEQVEAWQKAMAGAPNETSPPKEEYGINSSSSVPQEVRELLLEGKKIEAIIWHREKTGTGLKEAKEQVDKWEAELQLQYPESRAGQKNMRGGCVTVVLAIAIAIAGLVVYLMAK